jgi:hypothetical protein
VNENLEYAVMFARFPFAVRRFLKHRITLDDAKRIVRERMEQRAANLLLTVTRSVYNNPSSPYLALLKHAGCEVGDFRALVTSTGVEPALRQLRDAGVYVTFEEFKGRKPIVRNGLTIPTRASDFDNPQSRRELASRTGGSTGAAVKVAIDLDYIAARASQRLVTLAAHDLIGAPTAMWRGILPDRTFGNLLAGALTDTLPMRWFSPIGLRDSRHWLKYGIGSYYLIACMRAAGIRLPLPEFVPMERALTIAQFAVATARTHGRVLMRGGTSRAVRVAIAAHEAGLDLSGVTFMGAGEPATDGKVRQIERVGARFISNYGMSDAGMPGPGCAKRVGVSDYHLMTDTVALFPYPHRVEAFGVTVPAFVLTTLLPLSPKVMLNVETDDFGIVEERHCGCELESYGYTTHLREVRSYSKLTGEGVTLIGDEMIHILETTLPARFGGTSFDYQLMEDEDDQGFTRLYVIVSPRIELQSERAVIECVLEGLRQSSPAADAARLTWQNADTLQVKRMEPVWTERHKYLPLYMPRRYQTASLRTGGQS